LEEYALRALARRSHSVSELRQKLRRRAATTDAVQPLLERLADRGWLDDYSYALAFARHRAQHRRFGRYRIARELRKRGVADELIDEAVCEALPAEEDELALLCKRLDRRLRNQRPPYPDKLLRSLYASLLRAGFPSAIIRDELFRRTKQSVPEDVVDNEDPGP